MFGPQEKKSKGNIEYDPTDKESMAAPLHFSYNYNYIDSVIEVNDKFDTKKVKPILSHFNYVHCGVGTLNMSKIIMNKVFSCADDCNIKI